MKLVEWGVIGLEVIAFSVMIGILWFSLPVGGLITDLSVIHILIDLGTYTLLAYFIDERIRRKR